MCDVYIYIYTCIYIYIYTYVNFQQSGAQIQTRVGGQAALNAWPVACIARESTQRPQALLVAMCWARRMPQSLKARPRYTIPNGERRHSEDCPILGSISGP